jgi:hypothetical protein
MDRRFVNKYGVVLIEIRHKMETAFVNSDVVYMALSEYSSRFYQNITNIAVIDGVPLESDGYIPTLELEVLSKKLPEPEEDCFLFGMDIVLYDLIIHGKEKTVVYDIASKYDVEIPLDFFEESQGPIRLIDSAKLEATFTINLN